MNYHFSIKELDQIKKDSFFSPLFKLFQKFGQNYDDGTISVNLSRPVMPNPSETKWNLLPFNEGDCLQDLIWDLFQKHGQNYQNGVLIFDNLRCFLGCIRFTPEELDHLKTSLGAYCSDYEGTEDWSDSIHKTHESILKKLG